MCRVEFVEKREKKDGVEAAGWLPGIDERWGVAEKRKK
jgi:hypothetical protein